MGQRPARPIVYRFHILDISSVKGLEEIGEALREQGFSMICFLYDWHTHARETGKHFHGFTHPREALRNADRYFNLSWEEEMIILRHMWPLTPVPPVTKAGYAITCADKLCSTLETTARFKRWLMMCFFCTAGQTLTKGEREERYECLDTNAGQPDSCQRSNGMGGCPVP